VRKTTSIIQRTKIHEQLVELLMDDIMCGRYSIGEQLPAERELMETYGVGRPAVREAIAKLALMGVVDVQAGVRARVRRPTLTRLLDEMGAFIKMFLLTPDGNGQLQEARIMFEVALVRRFAREHTDAQMVELAEALKRCEDTLDDMPLFTAADVYFHSLFAEFTDNPLFTGLNGALGNWLVRQRTATLSKPGQSRIAYAAHRDIYDAIVAADADAAERAMRNHLEQVHSVWFENLPQGSAVFAESLSSARD
jgi:GntR family transcriptional repressor for pyruvate dehydrogenase complex